MQPSPFRASAFEYKFRFILHAVIYALGFLCPWNYVLHLDHNAANTTAREAVFTLLAEYTSLSRELEFFYAVCAVTLVFAALGALLRTWGTAYVSASVVQSRAMHGETMLADGPFRYTRNPLYLGTLLHTIALAMVMPPSGAVVAVVLIWVLQVRLALAEEPFLAAKFGKPYLEYVARVPRFLPALTPRVPSAGATPHWMQALLGEFYFNAAFVMFAVFLWSFNVTPLKQGLLISLGAWLVVRAFLPRMKAK